MEKLKYFLKEGFRNIKSNGFLSFASIGVLTICLIMLGSMLLFSLNVNRLIGQIESKNLIMVYLKEGLGQSTIDDIRQELLDISNVNQVTFVSKHEALQQAKDTMGEQSTLLSGLENDNPLPDAYKVETKNMAEYSKTAKQIQKINGIETVRANTPVAEKLTTIQLGVNVSGAVLFVILFCVSLFLISNTIKIAVFIRRREINIMKFVGATDGFIRWPFVVEGVFIGLTSGLVGILAEYFIYNELFSKLFTVLSVDLLQYNLMFLYLGVCFVLLGMVVGVFGSLLSLHKHLNV